MYVWMLVILFPHSPLGNLIPNEYVTPEACQEAALHIQTMTTKDTVGTLCVTVKKNIVS